MIDKWLIYSFEHKGWWKPLERGYTKDVRKAGIYPFDVACRIVIDATSFTPDKINEAMLPAPTWLTSTKKS